MYDKSETIFKHPMGELIITTDKKGNIERVRFKPIEDIDTNKIKALDWFFEDKDGRFTGWGTALKEGGL